MISLFNFQLKMLVWLNMNPTKISRQNCQWWKLMPYLNLTLHTREELKHIKNKMQGETMVDFDTRPMFSIGLIKKPSINLDIHRRRK